MWKNEKNLSKRNKIKEVYNIFSNNFKISSFCYDFAKFYIFKVMMQAEKLGTIKKNKYVNFELIIKSYDEYIVNETQSLGLLNYRSKAHEMRVGEIVYFYFTDLYG
jgi:hypothetical protein